MVRKERMKVGIKMDAFEKTLKKQKLTDLLDHDLTKFLQLLQYTLFGRRTGIKVNASIELWYNVKCDNSRGKEIALEINGIARELADERKAMLKEIEGLDLTGYEEF